MKKIQAIFNERITKFLRLEEFENSSKNNIWQRKN